MVILKTKAWTLESGLLVIRNWQKIAWECNLHLALAGSVLNNSESFNDLDIICMAQHNGAPTNWPAFYEFLWKKADSITNLAEQSHYENEGRELYRIKTKDNRKIDLFRYDLDL